jgi:outer membrane protein TolC
MNFSALRRGVTAFLAIWFYTTTFGQQYPDSLVKYLQIAAENNPMVRSRFAEYEAAMQRGPQAGSLPDPELTFGVLVKPMELVNGRQMADIRLMQMFPWFGVLKNARDEQSLMASAKFEQFRDARLQIYYDLLRTWYELCKIDKEISISMKNMEILKTIERLATIQFGSPAASAPMQRGVSSLPRSPDTDLSDIYRIQIESGDLENSIEFLKDRKNTVTARLNSYMNRPPMTPVYMDFSIYTDSSGISLAPVPDSILTNNPLLQMLESEKKAYEAQKKKVTAMGYPMIGLGMDYSINSKKEMVTSSMNGRDMIMPMVSVTLPVWRKKYRAMKTEADLLGRAAGENYQATSNTLRNEYFEAVQLYQDAGRRIKLYRSQYELASRTLDILLKRYSTSAASLTDVLKVRQQILDYEVREIEAATDFRTAEALLNRLMASSQIQ